MSATLTIRRSGISVLVSWLNETPPVQLIQSATMAGPWTNTINPTMATGASVCADQPQMFFRLRERIVMPLAADYDGATTELVWAMPDV